MKSSLRVPANEVAQISNKINCRNKNVLLFMCLAATDQLRVPQGHNSGGLCGCWHGAAAGHHAAETLQWVLESSLWDVVERLLAGLLGMGDGGPTAQNILANFLSICVFIFNRQRTALGNALCKTEAIKFWEIKGACVHLIRCHFTNIYQYLPICVD